MVVFIVILVFPGCRSHISSMFCNTKLPFSQVSEVAFTTTVSTTFGDTEGWRMGGWCVGMSFLSAMLWPPIWRWSPVLQEASCPQYSGGMVVCFCVLGYVVVFKLFDLVLPSFCGWKNIDMLNYFDLLGHYCWKKSFQHIPSLKCFVFHGDIFSPW